MENLRRSIEIIFNNWTGLQMAVQECGTSEAISTVMDMIDNVFQTLEKAVVGTAGEFEKYEMIDYFDYMMDEAFDTVCEDGSPEEVVSLLEKLVIGLRTGGDPLQLPEIKCLSTTRNWIPLSGDPKVIHRSTNLPGSRDLATPGNDVAAVVGSRMAVDVNASASAADIEGCEEAGKSWEFSSAENEMNDPEEPMPLTLGIGDQNWGRKKKSHSAPIQTAHLGEAGEVVREADDGGWTDVTRRKH